MLDAEMVLKTHLFIKNISLSLQKLRQHLSVYLSIYLYIYLSIYLSIYLYIYYIYKDR